mgnify:CR=1 FL=1
MAFLAKEICKANYGLHSLLSEVIDIKRASKYKQDHEFADGLERLLLEGHD